MSSQSAITATTAWTQLLPLNRNRCGLMVKNPAYNTDRVFLQLVGYGSVTAITATAIPLEIGETLMLFPDFANLGSADWPQAVGIAANSGSQNVPYIEFTQP